MELILKGIKEERFVINEKTANIIREIIKKEKQNESLDFMLQNAGKLRGLEIEEKEIYLQGD